MTSFSTEDVLAMKAKYGPGGWMSVNLDEMKSNKNTAHKCFYIPVSVLDATGKKVPLNMKFNSQLLASSAKSQANGTDAAKGISVAFKKLSASDLANTTYVKDDSEKTQKKVASLLKANKMFIEALDFIADEYLNVVKTVILRNRERKITFVAGCKTVTCFRQTHRNPGKGEKVPHESTGEDESSDPIADMTAGKIPFENPLYRVKFNASRGPDRRIGFDGSKGFIYQVFDLTRTLKKTTEAAEANKAKGISTPAVVPPVVAKIKTESGYEDLTIDNAGHFITYMSAVTGKISVEQICISKSGISLLVSFRELLVAHHKHMPQGGLDSETADTMRELGIGDGSDDEEPIYDPKAAAKAEKPRGRRQIDDEDSDVGDPDEPSENGDSDEPTSPPVKTKKSEKPEKLEKTKSAKKAKPASDDDASDAGEPESPPVKAKKPETKKTDAKTQKKAKPTDDESDASEPPSPPVKAKKPDAKDTKEAKKSEKKGKDADSDDAKSKTSVKPGKLPKGKPQPEEEPEEEDDAADDDAVEDDAAEDDVADEPEDEEPDSPPPPVKAPKAKGRK